MCSKGKKKKRKSPIKDWRKVKEKEKFSIKDQKKAKEKYTERSLDQTMSEWCTELSQAKKLIKTKETMNWNTWSSPSWLLTKSLCPHLFHVVLNKKRERQRPKLPKSSFPPRSNFLNVLLIHDYACCLWFDRKWFAKSSHDISMVRN